MAKENICLDTSILIDYYRKKNKSKAKLVELSKKYEFSISVITKFEILNGTSKDQNQFWNTFFTKVTIIPLDNNEIEIASNIYKNLKKENKLIDIPDILIASTAISQKSKLATLNVKHFERIKGLKLA